MDARQRAIFQSLIAQLYNGDATISLEELVNECFEQPGGPLKILDRCKAIMTGDQRNMYDEIENTIQKDFMGTVVGNDDDDTISSSSKQKIYMCAGLPGTGKSFLQDCIHAYCHTLILSIENAKLNNEREPCFLDDVLVVAPTNLIALQQRGQTLHRAVKGLCNDIGIKNYKLDENLATALAKEESQQMSSNIEYRAQLRERDLTSLVGAILQLKYKKRGRRGPNSYNVVLVDEGSMISTLSFAMLVAAYPTNCNTLFVVFYGPNQLPPISPTLNLKSFCNRIDFGEDFDQRWHFLRTQVRFSKDTEAVFREFVEYFNGLLDDEGRGGCGAKKINNIDMLDKVEYFYKNIHLGGTLRDYEKSTEGDKILIVATNRKRDIENKKRLETEGVGEIYCVEAVMDVGIPQNYDVYGNLGVDAVLSVKEGVKCICRTNNYMQCGLVKGMMLIVDSIVVNRGGDVVEIYVSALDHRGGSSVKMTREAFETQHTNINRKPMFVKQFPLTLGYAMTGHGCQGKTLTCKVGIDLETRQAWNIKRTLFFVAVTRVKQVDQIYMDGHPVWWLFEDEISINSLADLAALRKQLMIPQKRKLGVEPMERRKAEEDDTTTEIFQEMNLMWKNVQASQSYADFIGKGNIDDIEQIKKICI